MTVTTEDAKLFRGRLLADRRITSANEFILSAVHSSNQRNFGAPNVLACLFAFICWSYMQLAGAAQARHKPSSLFSVFLIFDGQVKTFHVITRQGVM